jgi:hypothetical protein
MANYLARWLRTYPDSDAHGLPRLIQIRFPGYDETQVYSSQSNSCKLYARSFQARYP